MQLVHHSPIIQELLSEKFQSGEQKGREEGHYEKTLKTIPKMLKFRFSVEATVFEKNLRSLDLKALEQLEDAIFTVKTLAEFEKVLNDMMLEKPLTINN